MRIWMVHFFFLATSVVAAEPKWTPALLPDVSHRAQVITGLIDGYGYEARMAEIHRLGKNIHASDVDLYFQFLAKSADMDVEPLEKVSTLKNDVADRLLAQKVLPKASGEAFLSFINDGTLSLVWQDYVLQKIPELLGRVSDPHLRKALVDALLAALQRKEQTLAGTALLSLGRISEDADAGVELSHLAQEAYRVAADETYTVSSRLTALQLASRLGHSDVYRLARSILVPTSPVPLQVSAIAVMGKHGSLLDLELLERYRQSADIRLRASAKSAIQKLQ